MLWVTTLCRMSEPPFRPREKLIEKQKYFQSVHKHTYLKGPYDKITSVAIPLALAASSLYLIVGFFVITFHKSSYNLYWLRRLNISITFNESPLIFWCNIFLTLSCTFLSGKRDLQHVTRNREERMTYTFFAYMFVTLIISFS